MACTITFHTLDIGKATGPDFDRMQEALRCMPRYRFELAYFPKVRLLSDLKNDMFDISIGFEYVASAMGMQIT